jgi:thioredoxin reductase (NADPH)
MTDTGERPVLFAIDDDREALGRIAGELSRRYGDDYRVVSQGSADAALAELEAMRDSGEPVAVVLADQWIGEETGSELLARVRALHPQAKRALLIDWGAWSDQATAEAVLRAMALGHIDYYAIKPWRVPDEQFHRLVSEFIYEWCRANSSQSREITVVAQQWSPRAHELRDILTRSGVPHAFLASGSSDARRLLSDVDEGIPGDTEEPIAVMRDGRVMVAPSNTELAQAFGVRTELETRRDFDVIVIGAGPAGLAAAVYAASEGLRALVVERESIGGQAGSTSLIRNYLGFSRGVSGGELAQRAYQQAWVFGTEFLMMREAADLRTEGDRHVVTVPEIGEVGAPAVVLATGVSYRRLGLPSLEELAGAGVFYGASISEARALAGESVYVVGGGNSAGQAAMHLSRWAGEVTLLVRGPSLAKDMSSYLREEIAAAANVRVRLSTEVTDGSGAGRLERLTIRDNASGESQTVEAAAVFILIGARPRTAWLPDVIERDEGGYLLTGADLMRDADAAASWPLERPPLAFETSAPGVFAVGDVRHGSVKRVAAAVGQGSVVIQQVHELLTEPRTTETPEEAAWR